MSWRRAWWEDWTINIIRKSTDKQIMYWYFPLFSLGLSLIFFLCFDSEWLHSVSNSLFLTFVNIASDIEITVYTAGLIAYVQAPDCAGISCTSLGKGNHIFMHTGPHLECRPPVQSSPTLSDLFLHFLLLLHFTLRHYLPCSEQFVALRHLSALHFSAKNDKSCSYLIQRDSS